MRHLDDGAMNAIESRLGAIQSQRVQKLLMETSRAAYRLLYEDLPVLLALEKKLKEELKKTKAEKKAAAKVIS
jgi:hypothetical protein